MANPIERALADLIAARRARLGVIGLGYVGLPLACTFAEGGFPVVGFDADPEKVARLARGESYIAHQPAARLRPLIAPLDTVLGRDGAGRLAPTTELERLRACDAVLICVPTPLTASREPDLSFVVASTEAVARTLHARELVVLESTTYPGTTDEVVRPRLESTGLVVGREVFLAFSPEREDPTNPRYTTRTIPKLVGGVTPACTRLAAALYGAVIERPIVVRSARVAEAAKILENTYRSVNIALVNELKMLFDRMGIDVWEVVEAAATKPFGFTPFAPGPGLGGHCIPVDPFYLSWKARQHGFTTRFIELAGEINTGMPEWVLRKLDDALNARGRAVRGARVLVLGVAYKPNVDDTRESPALHLLELLRERGARVAYHDPWVPALGSFRRYRFNLRSTPLTADTLRRSDAVLVVTAHDAFDPEFVVRHSRLVVDTRNFTRAVRAGRERIVRA
ncbi:MAG TPA: nucleotide sugar dehydrogenase [Candidatus Binatia bacterium]|nr:nucleotide sugar dehydrogenase [Candidatus Binatia bacterium]